MRHCQSKKQRGLSDMYIKVFGSGTANTTMSTKKKNSLKFQGKEGKEKMPTQSSANTGTPKKQSTPSPSKVATSSPTKCCASNGTPVIAYVHKLSKMQRNKKNTLDYATLTLQTENETREALLYSKLNRPLLVDSSKSRTPIKIQRFALSADGKKLIINDITNISTPSATEYSFQYKEETAVRDSIKIRDIIASADEWDLVSLVAKSIRVEQPKCVMPRDGIKKLKLAETLFADDTGVR